MIDYLLILSSLLAVMGMAMLAFGYRASLFSPDLATRFFSWSMVWLAVSVFGRRITWDILYPVVTGQVDQRPLNILFNAVAIFAVYAGLRARLLLIPSDERSRWRWWSCWWHPAIWRIRVDHRMGDKANTELR